MAKTRKSRRSTRRRTMKKLRKSKKGKRGGGLGQTSATWPPDNSSFGRFVGSPISTDNLTYEKK